MTRMARSLSVDVLSALIAAVMATVATGHARAADALIVTHRIPVTLALKAVAEAVRVCSAEGYTESAVLVDEGGNQQASLRGDGEGLATLENADHKAYTAVAYNVDTSALVAKARSGAEMSPALNRLPRLILAPGGVVIIFNNEIVGAIGASGSPFGAKDEACARAGAATITDSLK
jgi:uncharacterized protein GlcG (DUF336 family)